jgi:hypothetical protein
VNLCATCHLAGRTCPRYAPGEAVELCVEYQPNSRQAHQEAVAYYASRSRSFEHWQCLARLLLMEAE